MPVASYLYDHRGLRGRKTLSNPPAGVSAITLYTHDPNGHLFQEIAGSGPNAGQALVTYLWQDDVPAAIVLGPNTPGNPSAQDKLLYLEVDHLNTPRIARDEQKRVVWRWDSDAFGNTAPNEDPDGDGIKTTINLRFPGQYFDAESGLHYNWHRYYDPQTGRYTQPDPIGVEGGVNPYAYVGGNPLSSIDPDGLQAYDGQKPPASIPGGPWEPAGPGQQPGTYFGPSKPGGRDVCRYVPDQANGGPAGADQAYWKTKSPNTPWQRYSGAGVPITAAQAHAIPSKGGGGSGSGGGFGGGGGGRPFNPFKIPYN